MAYTRDDYVRDLYIKDHGVSGSENSQAEQRIFFYENRRLREIEKAWPEYASKSSISDDTWNDIEVRYCFANACKASDEVLILLNVMI